MPILFEYSHNLTNPTSEYIRISVYMKIKWPKSTNENLFLGARAGIIQNNKQTPWPLVHK
jgi:hypothetical protein